MHEFKLTTPVAFIIFNRPDTTARVFSEIAKAKPPKILVIGDGPRATRAKEAERVAETRKIIENVDWPCEVLTNYSEINMGCKNRVSSGLDWVFEQVEEAIILEDDCLPHPTFFQYCEELLMQFRDDSRVGMISGDNFQLGTMRGAGDYYFSRYTHIWGWATWRRAWRFYDRDINAWPMIRNDELLESIFCDETVRDYWKKIMDDVFNGAIDTWDYQWCLACWQQSMLAIMPNVNLVSNIGFGSDATHTTSVSIYSDMPTVPMSFPIRHPNLVMVNHEADKFTANNMFKQSFCKGAIKKCRLFGSKILKYAL